MAFTDSYNSFGEYLRALKARPQLRPYDTGARTAAPSSWNGNTTYADALKLAEDGWREGTETLVKAVALAQPALSEIESPVKRWNVAGSSFDIGAYVTGAPECFRVRQREPERRVIRLLCILGALASVNASELVAYGAALASLVVELEAQDEHTTVELVGEYRAQGHGIGSTRITLKAAGEDLDLVRLAFPLIHPAAHRRIRFAYLETQADWSGTGGTLDWPEVRNEDEVALPGVHVLAEHGATGTPADATRWLVKWFNEQPIAHE